MVSRYFFIFFLLVAATFRKTFELINSLKSQWRLVFMFSSLKLMDAMRINKTKSNKTNFKRKNPEETVPRIESVFRINQKLINKIIYTQVFDIEHKHQHSSQRKSTEFSSSCKKYLKNENLKEKIVWKKLIKNLEGHSIFDFIQFIRLT